MKEYKIKNKIMPAELGEFALGGSIGKRIDKYFGYRVLSDFARDEVFAEAERQFELQNDDELAVGYWRGEFWGKLAISGARVCRYYQNEDLKDFLLSSARRIIKNQRPNGYIGTYSDEDNVFTADPDEVEKIIGQRRDWNWNVWCRKYTLWGLLEIYRITGANDILDAAIKHADHLIAQLKRLEVHLCDVGTFNGLPAGSIIKPMLLLYAVTEDEKYLDFCIDEAELWDRADGRVPNIIKNALENKPVYEWYDKPELWAKAYEFMSCLDGLCELYRYTGDERYFNTVKNCYESIKKYDMNVLFSVGFNDQFTGAARWENSISEPCDVIHWMRVCHELYLLTGDIKYVDDIEVAYLNPLMAAVLEKPEKFVRGVRSSGRHMLVTGQCGLTRNHCCGNNMPRGILNAAESYCMFSDKCLYINMYTEYSGKLDTPLGKINVDISGSYLSDGKVKIKLESENDIDVMLRIPCFAENTVVDIKTEIINPASGGYCRVKTKSGVSEIDIKFDFKPIIHDFKGEVVSFADDDYRFARFGQENLNNVDRCHMVWDRRSTLTYGPLLLTRSKCCGNTAAEMFENEKTVCNGGYTCSLSAEKADDTNLKFNAFFENDSDSFETYVCDYATGTCIASEDDMELFSIWF